MKLASARVRLAATLLGASAVSVILYLFGVAFNHDDGFYYLIWNLFLAWLPLVFVLVLLAILDKHLWSSWRGLLVTVIWLVFLPNSFYLISDFLHIYDVANASVTYNIALFASFALNGVILGYLSVWLVHKRLLARGHDKHLVWTLIGLVLLISSYAIFLGRYVRLNSWDVFTNFSAVLFSISDQVLHPSGYPAVIGVSFSFFLLLGSIYLVIWRLSSDILEFNEAGTRAVGPGRGQEVISARRRG